MRNGATASGRPPTRDALVEREPRLADLLAEARRHRPRSREPVCANAILSGYGEYRGRGIKNRPIRLVGWASESPDPTLHTSMAYDTAYHAIYCALPDCRRCACPTGLAA